MKRFPVIESTTIVSGLPQLGILVPWGNVVARRRSFVVAKKKERAETQTGAILNQNTLKVWLVFEPQQDVNRDSCIGWSLARQ